MTELFIDTNELSSNDGNEEMEEEYIIPQYKLEFELFVLLASLQKENPNYFSKIESITLSPLEINDMKQKLKNIAEMLSSTSKSIDISVFPTFIGRQIYDMIEYIIEKESSLFDIKQGIKKGFYLSCDKPIWNLIGRYLSYENPFGFESEYTNHSKKKSCYVLLNDLSGNDLNLFYLKKKDIFPIYRSILRCGK
jgi:hypothetical protein